MDDKDRIDRGLRELGAGHQPPPDWQSRVHKVADAIDRQRLRRRVLLLAALVAAVSAAVLVALAR